MTTSVARVGQSLPALRGSGALLRGYRGYTGVIDMGPYTEFNGQSSGSDARGYCCSSDRSSGGGPADYRYGCSGGGWVGGPHPTGLSGSGTSSSEARVVLTGLSGSGTSSSGARVVLTVSFSFRVLLKSRVVVGGKIAAVHFHN